jgi:hypothetical protein
MNDVVKELFDTFGAFAIAIEDMIAEAVPAPEPNPIEWWQIVSTVLLFAVVLTIGIVLLRRDAAKQRAAAVRLRQHEVAKAEQAKQVAVVEPMTSAEFKDAIGFLLGLFLNGLISNSFKQKHALEVEDPTETFRTEARMAPQSNNHWHVLGIELNGTLAVRSKSLVIEVAWLTIKISGGGDEFRSDPDEYREVLYVKPSLAGVDISSRPGLWWGKIRNWLAGVSADLHCLNEAYNAAQVRDMVFQREQEGGFAEAVQQREEDAAQRVLSDAMARSHCP